MLRSRLNIQKQLRHLSAELKDGDLCRESFGGCEGASLLGTRTVLQLL